MEFTSPLTTLTSISTPASYHTAQGSPSNAADETGLSSPLEELPPGELLPYRAAVPLPHELKSHCQIHLEEQLYTAAIHILSGLLSDGAPPACSHPKQLPKPARIPPPSQLALLATIVVHPAFTTSAPETANIHAAAHALSYLRGLLSTVGPINANFRAAFDFTASSTSSGPAAATTRSRAAARPGSRPGSRGGSRSRSRHSSGAHNNNTAYLSSDDEPPWQSDSDSDALGGDFARSDLLFRRAPDFWAVLGWAFRCAAEHPARWRCWREWLGFVLAAVEADFDERLREDQAAVGQTGKSKSTRPYPALGGSLIVAYLLGLRRARRNPLREVLRAVFAFCDGEMVASDRAIFGEVFRHETKLGRSKRKRAEDNVVDLENDRFGDYLDDGESLESEEESEGEDVPMPAPAKGRRKPGRKAKGEGTASLALTDSLAETVPFRLRVFRLLSAVSYYLPDTFEPVGELYERFTDQVRSLPLPMFRLFIEPHRSILPEEVQVSFLRMVIEALLPRHPDPAEVDAAAGHGVTVRVMQECFLPFAASRVTAEDNAKLSLALERMMWFVYGQIGVEYSPGLRRAVEAGIKAREDKIKRRGAAGAAGRADAADKAAREALARSARNLRALVDVIAAAGR